jgi:glycosyltransferase involved in cell wall biosynthesis
LNILIIPSWYPTEKDPIAGIFIQQQAIALQKEGVKLSILFFEENTFSKKAPFLRTEHGINVIRSKGWVPPKRIKPLRILWLKKWEELFEFYTHRYGLPTLLHAHSFVGGYIAKYLSGKYDIPYVLTEHFSGFIKDNIPKHWKLELPLIYNKASKIIAVSTSLKQKLCPYTNTEIKVIPNILDIAVFYPNTQKPSLPPLRLLTVGSLIRRKNISALLKALAALEIEAILHIVGQGPLLHSIKREARKLRVIKKVIFTGNLPPKKVADVMRRSHFFVFASQSETFGVVLIEAMACGLPIISTPCGIAEELIQMGGGRIVNTEEEMAKAIVNLTKEYSTFDATHLHKVVKSNYSGAIVAHKIKSLYASLVD